MSPVDAVMPLLQEPWTGRRGEKLPIVPLPGIRPEAITNLEAHWAGTLTPQMRDVLRRSCGLSGTPLGNIDFTGRWFPEEPLSIFRPCLTLAVDERGCRWIAELGKGRGLPGPVWCIFPRPEVALLIDRNVADFLDRLHHNIRRESMSDWLTTLSIRARKLWASRHGRAISVPVAFSRLKEIRGWLAGLPVNAWVYDLRAPGETRGLPYGLMHERGQLYRCGRLLVFAFAGCVGPAANGLRQRSGNDCENGVCPSYCPPQFDVLHTPGIGPGLPRTGADDRWIRVRARRAGARRPLVYISKSPGGAWPPAA